MVAEAAAAEFFVLVLLVVGAGIYFIPTIVALNRKVPNAGSVVVINIFLGWSLIGWVVALSMASRSVPPQTAINVHTQSFYAGMAAPPQTPLPTPGSWPPASTPQACWSADPWRRYELRYWDGQRWTQHVSTGGSAFVDPVT